MRCFFWWALLEIPTFEPHRSCPHLKVTVTAHSTNFNNENGIMFAHLLEKTVEWLKNGEGSNSLGWRMICKQHHAGDWYHQMMVSFKLRRTMTKWLWMHTDKAVQNTEYSSVPLAVSAWQASWSNYLCKQQNNKKHIQGQSNIRHENKATNIASLSTTCNTLMKFNAICQKKACPTWPLPKLETVGSDPANHILSDRLEWLEHLQLPHKIWLTWFKHSWKPSCCCCCCCCCCCFFGGGMGWSCRTSGCEQPNNWVHSQVYLWEVGESTMFVPPTCKSM